MNDRDTNLERLLQHAADAERFAQWFDGGAEGAPRSAAGSSSLRWWLGGSAAAAAAIVAAFMLVRTTPTPVNPGPLASGPAQPSGNHTPVVPVARATGQKADLSPWFHLAPDAEDGIPSLTDERSVLLAVYQGEDTTCGCVAWRLADDARIAQAGTQVLAEAVNSPCRDHNSQVRVYAVSGPRYLLPFHDDDARELAQCLAASPGECVAPDAALEEIAGSTGDVSLSDLAASAIAMCVPSGLKVTSVSTAYAR
ncbi:MAG: hypothetical protein U0637_02290 [Phycisphaerales bacterium]